jgi:hypothetical protein
MKLSKVTGASFLGAGAVLFCGLPFAAMGFLANPGAERPTSPVGRSFAKTVFRGTDSISIGSAVQ